MKEQEEKFMLPIEETFVSIQGEGSEIGVKTFFIRVQGCAVGCKHCDTKYAWHVNKDSYLPIEGLVRAAQKKNCQSVSITGGEPGHYPEDVIALVEQLNSVGLSVSVETSGKRQFYGFYEDLDNYRKDKDVSICMDIKTPCTGVSGIDDFDNLKFMRLGDNVKCLIDTEEDLYWAYEVNKKLGGRCEMILQPFRKPVVDEGERIYMCEHLVSEYKDLVEKFINDEREWKWTRVTPQMHVLLYYGMRGY